MKLNVQKRKYSEVSSIANDCMIDLETLDLKSSAAIISIGAVMFDARSGIVTDKTFYAELDWRLQLTQGFTKSNSTVKWWKEQSAEAKKALRGEAILKDVLKQFSAWLPEGAVVWGNGPLFDIGKLEFAYNKCDLEEPWKFYNVNDCRTVKRLYEYLRGGFDGKIAGTAHHALDDAIWQAEYICHMWKSISAKAI